MSYPEADEVLAADTLVLLPLGSCEPHGPHLALGAATTLARSWCRAVAEALRQSSVRVAILPAVPYGLSHLTEGFAGRVTLQPGTLWALLDDLVTSLEQEGVRRVVFASAHLEPQHLRVLEGVALDHDGRPPGRARVVVLDTARAVSPGPDGEWSHAGAQETSIALSVDGAGVRRDVASALSPVALDADKIAGGYLAAGATQAYSGDPAVATAHRGMQLMDALVQASLDAIGRAWPDLST